MQDWDVDGADDLATAEVSWLAGGAWSAVRSGLVVLHVCGVVLAGRPGTVARTGSLPPATEALERALFTGLYGEMGPRELARRRAVRQALREVRGSLVHRGLIRPIWRRALAMAALIAGASALAATSLITRPGGLVAVVVLGGAAVLLLTRRTLRGFRVLRALRARHAHLLRDTGQLQGRTPREIGIAVALYGTPALRAIVPQFARQSGLLGRSRGVRYLGDGPLDSSSHLDAGFYDM
jgi:uncharacterized protein (TIGR04222 family)